MERHTIELKPGQNELPRLYNFSGGIGMGAGGPDDTFLRLLASTQARVATAPHQRRGGPSSTTVALPMSWNEAIDLAVEIARVCETAGVRLPPGVLIRGETH